MFTVIHIDAADPDAQERIRHWETKPRMSFRDALKDMGISWRAENIPAAPRPPRKLTPDVAEYIATYEYEDPPAVLAVVRRYGWLDSEEFDTAEEAKGFIESGEDWGSLAGEAIVDGDEIRVWD